MGYCYTPYQGSYVVYPPVEGIAAWARPCSALRPAGGHKGCRANTDGVTTCPHMLPNDIFVCKFLTISSYHSHRPKPRQQKAKKGQHCCPRPCGALYELPSICLCGPALRKDPCVCVVFGILIDRNATRHRSGYSYRKNIHYPWHK